MIIREIHIDRRRQSGHRRERIRQNHAAGVSPAALLGLRGAKKQRPQPLSGAGGLRPLRRAGRSHTRLRRSAHHHPAGAGGRRTSSHPGGRVGGRRRSGTCRPAQRERKLLHQRLRGHHRRTEPARLPERRGHPRPALRGGHRHGRTLTAPARERPRPPRRRTLSAARPQTPAPRAPAGVRQPCRGARRGQPVAARLRSPAVPRGGTAENAGGAAKRPARCRRPARPGRTADPRPAGPGKTPPSGGGTGRDASPAPCPSGRGRGADPPPEGAGEEPHPAGTAGGARREFSAAGRRTWSGEGFPAARRGTGTGRAGGEAGVDASAERRTAPAA